MKALFCVATVTMSYFAAADAYSQHFEFQNVSTAKRSIAPWVMVSSEDDSPQAVLGWTYEQCVKAYGKPVLQQDQFPAETRSVAYVFSDKGYAIGAVLVEGTMCGASFTALDEHPLSAFTVNDFKITNCPDAVWVSDAASRMEGTNWIGNVKGKVAFHANLGSDRTKLCIFTEEFMDRLKVAVRAGNVMTPNASTRERILAGLGWTCDQGLQAYGSAIVDLGLFHGVKESRYYLHVLQHLDEVFSLTIGTIYVGERISAVNYMELKDGDFLPLPESTVDFFLERSGPSEAWSNDADSTSKVGGHNWIGTANGKMCYRVNLTADRKRLTIMTDEFFNSIEVLTPDLFVVGK